MKEKRGDGDSEIATRYNYDIKKCTEEVAEGLDGAISNASKTSTGEAAKRMKRLLCGELVVSTRYEQKTW